MFSWTTFQSLVLQILTDAIPSDTTFEIACADFVKAKMARDFDRQIDRHDSYWKSYMQQRDRLVGYKYAGTSATLATNVNVLLGVDGGRQGAAAFIASMLTQAQLDIQNRSAQILEYIRLGIIDLQTMVPMYRIGQSTIFTVDDLILVGAASQGLMPEGAQITDGYYKQLTSSVTAVDMVNEGQNYTVANINFTGDGQNAAGLPIISHGKIIGVQMTMWGFGYTTCTISITGDGTGATAVAVLNA